MEKLEIKRGGKLVQTVWKNGKYVDIDRTNLVASFLFSPCILEEGTTLKDILLLCEKDLPTLDKVIGNYLKELVVEGLSKKAKEINDEYDSEKIEYLELKYTPEVDEYENVESFTGITLLSFGGQGVVLQEDYEYHKKGTRIPWSICMTPVNELVNIPLKLYDKFEVYEGIMKTAPKDKCKNLININNPEYTLGQIIYSIAWELSFHGGPYKRNKFRLKLDNITKNLKKEE